MIAKNSVIVAKLPGDKAPYPYTSLSSSPYGRLILIAGKDTIRFISIKPSGLKEVKSIRISHFFQATRSVGLVTTNNDNIANAQKRVQLNEVFLPNPAQGPTSTNIAITITDVSWSLRQNHNNDEQTKKKRTKSNDYTDIIQSSAVDAQNNETHAVTDMKKDPFQSIISITDDLLMADDSLIAVAGSNGVVVVWRTSDLLDGGFDDNSNQGFASGFGRNNYANDGTDHFHFFQQYMNPRDGLGNRNTNPNASSGGTRQPEAILVEHNRAVNCIAWHKHKPGVFLTGSVDGTVKMFERREIKLKGDDDQQNQKSETQKWKWFGKSNSSSSVKSYSWHYTGNFTPNCGPVRDIQWSNCNHDLFAMVTNNGFLVVHNMSLVNNGRPMVRIAAHAREATTLDWHPTEPYLIATGGVDKTVKVWDLESEIAFHEEYIPSNFKQNSYSLQSHGSSLDSGSLVSGDSSPVSNQDNDIMNHSYHGGTSSYSSTISSAQLKSRNAKNAAFTQIHELSVAAQVEKLRWRPPKLSSVERYLSHLNDYVDPHAAMLAIATSSGAASGGHGTVSLWSYNRPFMPLSIVDGHEEGAVTDFIWLDTPEANEDEGYIISNQEDGKSSLTGTWQHVLSIGRDGKCIVQSFARGERPLSDVAPSAFAITNLSPFQHGYGSLQIIAVHQNVPSGQNNDYMLSGLRRDELSCLAPGFYQEDLPSDDSHAINKFKYNPKECENDNDVVNLNFFVTDSGALNQLFSDWNDSSLAQTVKIAPEVVHLSRFAQGYKICTDKSIPTKAAICRFNAAVAATMKYEGHSRMWNILASILEGGNFENKKNAQASGDVMTFILYPTLKSLLLERADAGDVQHCVVLCEVMDVVVRQKNNIVSVAVPGLDILLVRQWYLSYIEILQQMCLFTHATHLIDNCKDPEIGKLNQKSTTIHEACPTCSKPLDGGKKSCRTCRRKIGLCFLCHEPVTGIFVMCPGCGHGGHLDHAIEWFSSLDNKFHEKCPTGCGHKCNFIGIPTGSHFPRTESLHQFSSFDPS